MVIVLLFPFFSVLARLVVRDGVDWRCIKGVTMFKSIFIYVILPHVGGACEADPDTVLRLQV